MKMKKWLLKAMAAGMSFFLLCLTCGSARGAPIPPPEQRRAQQRESLLKHIETLRKNTDRTQRRIESLETRIGDLRTLIGGLALEIKKLSAEVEDLTDTVRRRVVLIYKYGSEEEMNLVLAAESAHEAADISYLLGRIARRDRLIAEELLAKTAALEEAKSVLERNEKQLSELSGTLAAQRRRYESAIQETRKILARIQHEQKEAEAAASELEEAQRSVERVILARLERRRVREEDERAAGKTPERRDYARLASGERLDWPIKGPVYAPYGPRTHPVFKKNFFNAGIDIQAAAHAPVRAAGPGEVLFRGWLRGLGQVVIIDHGNQIFTVYAHLGSVRVQEGDAAGPETIVGTAGNTGVMENYGLHFEVRVRGLARNPLFYLKRA
ncbi:MAG: peptidoglycan DD-metalloendopeptidase family protein [Synergistaceae bacterium]|jgi:murein DD-endopeptidase MepM/ murein hydrolase activator NlpD|nr:peptidoglycan DD-metalloendopeptidase family protein [Synergistaceae bacterium]